MLYASIGLHNVQTLPIKVYSVTGSVWVSLNANEPTDIALFFDTLESVAEFGENLQSLAHAKMDEVAAQNAKPVDAWKEE